MVKMIDKEYTLIVKEDPITKNTRYEVMDEFYQQIILTEDPEEFLEKIKMMCRIPFFPKTSICEKCGKKL